MPLKSPLPILFFVFHMLFKYNTKFSRNTAAAGFMYKDLVHIPTFPWIMETPGTALWRHSELDKWPNKYGCKSGASYGERSREGTREIGRIVSHLTSDYNMSAAWWIVLGGCIHCAALLTALPPYQHTAFLTLYSLLPW